MVLIGQAALRSAVFDERLHALLAEFKARGCTVWLEGMSVRFDVPGSQAAWVKAGGLAALLRRYDDVVVWLQSEGARLEALPDPARSPAPETALPAFFSRWRAPKRAPRARL